MSDPQEPVEVFRSATLPEVHLLCGVLAEHGIAGTVVNENYLGFGGESIQLMVRRADQERAEAVIAEYQSGAAQEHRGSEWKCPNCGKTVLGNFDVCWSCGRERPQ